MAICVDSDDCDCQCILDAIATLEVRDNELYAGVNAAEALIAALDAAYQAADAALQAQITQNASDISALDVRVTQNEADILALQSLYYPPENILNYSAVAGTGAEDVATQLSQGTANAAAIASALSAHQKAYIPEGLFWMSGPVVVESGQEVYGRNRAETELRMNAQNSTIAGLLGTESFVMIYSALGALAYPSYTHHDGISIHGFTINLNSQNQTNENGALNGIRVYGDNTRIRNMRITEGRAGASKEAFWINVSGTFNVSYKPAKNTLIEDIIIDTAGPQSNGGTAECSLILVGGYLSGASTAENLAINTTVRDVVFRDLEQNGTTQLREIWGIAVFGAEGTIDNCHMTDNIVGDCSLIHYNSGSVDGQLVTHCHYDGEAQAVGLFRGLVGSYDPTFKNLNFNDCQFKSDATVCSFVNWTTGTGSLSRVHFYACTIIGNGSLLDRATPIVLEQREETALGQFMVTGCHLEGDSGSSGPPDTRAESGFYVFLTTAEYGVIAAVPTAVANRLIVGDNYDGFGGRATNRAFLDDSLTTITWTNNADFSDKT